MCIRDRISVVKPVDTEKLQIIDGKDYVTLVTCTPYGGNDHRLLVRGARTKYEKTQESSIRQRNKDSQWMGTYKRDVYKRQLHSREDGSQYYIYQMNVVFDQDGEYSLTAASTDLAGNKNLPVTYVGTHTAVSYTHLDVYKRQLWYVTSSSSV